MNFTTSPQRVNEIKTLVEQVMESLRKSGITSQELARAKQAWLVDNREQQRSAYYWALGLAQVATDGNDFSELVNQQTEIKNITIDDVNQLAARFIGSNKKEFTMMPR